MSNDSTVSKSRKTQLTCAALVVGTIVIGIIVSFPLMHASDEVVYAIDSDTALLRVSLGMYKQIFGAFPMGSSREICRALSGENQQHVRFVEMHSVTAEGDFLDPWGTPYRFYYSDDRPLIRSAGPNRQFDSSRKRKPSDDYFGG